MNRKDFYTGLLFLLLTGWIITQILRSPSSRADSGPGAFFLPAIAGLFIGGLSLALLVQSFRKPGSAGKPTGEKRMWGRILWIMGWCVIYALSMETLGYLLSTGMISFALFAYFNRGRWLANMILSLATPTLIFILFNTLLKVSMPRGWFGF
jgi:putative tricarboxylic transport membrane protein